MSIRARWVEVQRKLGVTPDGIPFGPETVGAVEDLLRGDPADIDPRSAATIESLDPKAQGTFLRLVRIAKEVAARHDLTAKAISGHRSLEEQDRLYAIGRTTPGRKVTNARTSRHNFGIAIDLGLFGARGYIDDVDPTLADRVYQQIADAAGDLPLVWGGDWISFPDPPHFEIDLGLSLAQLRSRAERGLSLFS